MKHGRLIRLAIYAALPFAFWGLWRLALLRGDSLCLLRTLTGAECPSCGATRAAAALLAGDLSAAWTANPVFTAGVYPLALFLIAQDVFVILSRRGRSLIEFLLTGGKS